MSTVDFVFLVVIPFCLFGAAAYCKIMALYWKGEYRRVFREYYGHGLREKPIPCVLCDCPVDLLEAEERPADGFLGGTLYRIKCGRCGHAVDWARGKGRAIEAWNKDAVRRIKTGGTPPEC